jgi:hypothetical protein
MYIFGGWVWWHMPEIPAIQEVENRTVVRGQCGQKSQDTHLNKQAYNGAPAPWETQMEGL